MHNSCQKSSGSKKTNLVDPFPGDGEACGRGAGCGRGCARGRGRALWGVAARVGVAVAVGVACARLQGPVQRFASVLSGSSDRIFLVTEVSIHFLGNQPLPMSREQSWTLATSEITENELGRRRCPPVIKGFVAGPLGASAGSTPSALTSDISETAE